VEAASGSWEQGNSPGEWSPRRICEHVCGAELGYAGAVASALGKERPAWETFELQSATEALGALDRLGAISDAIMALVEDSDLERLSPGGATVLDVMEQASAHLAEHISQLQLAS
jgi:hypothetical protein